MVTWNNDHDQSRAGRLADLKRMASSQPGSRSCESDDGAVTRFSYRLRDANDDGPVRSQFCGFAIDDGGHLQMSAYFDNPADEELARELVTGVSKQRGSAPGDTSNSSS